MLQSMLSCIISNSVAKSKNEHFYWGSVSNVEQGLFRLVLFMRKDSFFSTNKVTFAY